METTDFSKYRSKDQGAATSDEDVVEKQETSSNGSLGPSNLMEFSENSQLNEPPEQIFDASQYQTPEEKSLIRQGAELAGQGALGLAQGVLGAAGDTKKAFDLLTDYAGKYATDKISDLVGKQRLTDDQKKDFQKTLRDGSISKFMDMIFPSSDELEGMFNTISGDKVIPTTELQNKVRDIATDVGSLVSPITGSMSLLRGTGSVLFGEGAQKLAKEFGATESQQNKIKAASTFLASVMNPGAARRYSTNLVKDAYKEINPNDVIPTKPLLDEASAFNRNLLQGGVTPNKSVVHNLSKQFQNDLLSNPNGFSPYTLAKYRNSVNELRYSKGLGSQQGGLFPKGLPPQTQHFLNEFDGILNSGLNRYGTQNPTFLNKYREGQLALSGLNSSNRLQNTISKNIDLNSLNPETLAILGMHAGPQAAAGIGALAAVGKSVSIMKRIATNKPLRKHYLDVLKYGSQKNIPMLRRSLGFFDDAIGADEEVKN